MLAVSIVNRRARLLEPSLPELTGGNPLGFTSLCLLGGAATCFPWLRGIARLEPSMPILRKPPLGDAALAER